jgi:archaellum component FlaG (FlaF/FlaG flagellin family)
VIVTYSTSGSVADSIANVTDNHNTKFKTVENPNTFNFYYGFVQDMDDSYTLYVNGEKVEI